MAEGKGAKKYGRNKRVRSGALSAYIRGQIDFNSYMSQTAGGPKPALPNKKAEAEKK